MSFRGWAKPAALYSWFAMFQGVLAVAVLGVALLALSILDDGEADS